MDDDAFYSHGAHGASLNEEVNRSSLTAKRTTQIGQLVCTFSPPC